MINITLPDGSKKAYQEDITGKEIAFSISPSLAKSAIAIEIDGKLCDLSTSLTKDSKIRIITNRDPEALEIIRHDAAHILAQAAKELFPGIQVTIGPAIKDGFYYDFAKDTPFTSDDLVRLEKRMYEIVKRNDKFVREVRDRDKAVDFFKSINEYYKAEIIESIPEGEQVTLYRQGDFIDLCRGPHCPSTGKIKYFKLTKLAGAYWRGDSNNKMLQRIYGTAWSTKEELESYIHRLEEAEKRDHRKLGKALDLFHIQDEAQGMVFWHSKGWVLYRIIEQYIRNKLKEGNYKEVKTPMMVDSLLWKKSGHWDKFRENMFTVEDKDKIYALKPMNCPCHIQIFNQGVKSYRDLPYRISEFGSCHRNEASGALHGLLRVRNFVQDDGHIFCTEDQITDETIAFCKLLIEIYRDFGFEKIKVKFADRPDQRVGDDKTWDKSENALRDAVKQTKLDYEINPGEGAFYGPKLEFILLDAIGREWQCGTLQVDFVLPERLDAKYTDQDGTRKRPVMLHRAIIGTFERFIGILIEQYAGRFPLWLAPIQIGLVGITNDIDEYLNDIHQKLLSSEIRSELDTSKEKVNYKIRQFFDMKVPVIAIAGKKELESSTITLRFPGREEQKNMSVDDLIGYIHEKGGFLS